MIMLRRVAATVLAILAPVSIAVSYQSMRSDIPDPVPVHWNAHGVVDNTAPAHQFYVATIGIAVLLAVAVAVAIWLAHSPIAGRMLAALMMFGTWLAAAVFLGTLIASSGVARAQDVGMPWYAVAAIVVVPALIALGAWLILPGRWESVHAPAAAPTLTFKPGERVVWIGHQHSVALRVAAPILAIAGAVLLLRQPSIAIPALIFAVIGGLMSEIAVRIDERGVHTLWGPFGWPHPVIPLSDIVTAHAMTIHPMSWGGWGYRVSSRGVAAIIRGGPGIVVERTDRPSYAVTVQGAERGADVLNALLARAQAAVEEPGSGSGSHRGPGPNSGSDLGSGEATEQ